MIDDIRARLAVLIDLFIPTVRPHKGEDYFSIVDKWDQPILSISAVYLSPERVERAIDALLKITVDIRALLDQHDADQRALAVQAETIMGLTTICEQRGDLLDKYEAVFFYLGVETAIIPGTSTPQEIAMIIRAAMKGSDDDNS